MSLTSAMMIGFTGIKSNTVAVDTIGDNVANVNTTAFKTQRALFETVLYRTLRGGEAPADPLGGTNPVQVGYGSGVAAIQRNFAQGSVQTTGVPSDLAIDGRGFFIVNNAAGGTVSSRAPFTNSRGRGANRPTCFAGSTSGAPKPPPPSARAAAHGRGSWAQKVAPMMAPRLRPT